MIEGARRSNAAFVFFPPCWLLVVVRRQAPAALTGGFVVYVDDCMLRKAVVRLLGRSSSTERASHGRERTMSLPKRSRVLHARAEEEEQLHGRWQWVKQ